MSTYSLSEDGCRKRNLWLVQYATKVSEVVGGGGDRAGVICLRLTPSFTAVQNKTSYPMPTLSHVHA